MQNAATVGTLTHDGVQMSSNTMTSEQMRSTLGIESPESPDPADAPESTEAASPETPAADAPVESKATPDQPVTDKSVSAKAKKNPQERIDRLTFEREEAKREAQRTREDADRKIESLRAEWQREFEALKKGQQAPAERTAPVEDAEPKLEDFADQADPYAAWMRASAKYDLKQELKAQQEQAREAFQRQQGERQQQERHHHELGRIKSWTERMQTAFQKTPDLQAQIEAMPLLPRPMMDVIVDSEIPDQILAHFLQHPEEQARIQGLPPLHQFRAVSRLEYQLESAANTGSVAQVKPKTNAHPPVSPVSGAHAAPPATGEPGPDASYEEHRAYWNAKEAEQRRARR